MRISSFYRWITAVLLCLLTAACTGGEQPAPAAPAEIALPTVAGTAAPLPTVTPTPTSEALPPTNTPPPPLNNLTLNADNHYGRPDADSYKVRLVFSSAVPAEDGAVTEGGVQIEGARDTAVGAETFTATATGATDFGDGQTFNYTQVGSNAYMILPNDTCVSVPADSGNNDMFAIYLEDDGVLGAVNGAVAAVPPTTTVNGILTNHYTFDETHLVGSDSAGPTIRTAEGGIYVAVDGGYVVRIEMTGTGSSDLVSGEEEGRISYTLDYFDMGVPVDIVPPDGC